VEAFLLQAFWATFFMVVATAIAPAPDRPEDKKASTLGDVDAPTISEGSSVPVVIGSVLTGKQNVSWFGGLRSDPITQQGVVTGHRYYITAQLSICHGPIDDIREVRLEDTVIPAANAPRTATTDYWDYLIDAPTLLGGEDQEGGISGRMRLYRGTLTQVSDIEIATLVGESLPAYRGICYAVLREVYLGTSARLKGLSFIVEHCPNRLGVPSGRHIISDHRDSNAVCALYEILRDDFWGAGLAAEQFDTVSWLAAAEVAYTEGLGVSMTLTSQSVEDAVNAIKKYLDAVVYEDLATGLVTIKLIRETDLSGAPSLGRGVIDSVDITRLGWGDLRNAVKVTFTDPTRNYEVGGVMALNSAALAMTGGAQDVEVLDAPAFTNREVAQRSAERLLRSLSYPLSKVEVRGNRHLASLRPGDAFRLVWSRPAVDTYYRVTRVEQGVLSDGGVTISAVEDVFSASAGTFTAPPGSTWTPETSTPAQPVTAAALLETPYHLRRSDTRSVIYGAAAPTVAHTGWRAIVNGSTADASVYPWMMHAPLSAAIPQWSGAELAALTLAAPAPTAVVTPTPAQYDAGESLLLVGSELMAYRGVTRNANGTTTFTGVTRAVLDTVPAGHAIGTRVLVLPSLALRAGLDLTTDQEVQIGAQTMTSTNTQNVLDAAISRMTTVSRALRPYPPGAVSVNGVAWGAGPHSYPATVSWEPRTRAAVQVVDQLATGQTAEAGVSYLLEVFDADGVTLVSSHPITGTSHELADHGNFVLTLRSRRGGVDSLQTHRLAVTIGVNTSHLLAEDNKHLVTEAGDTISTE